jgi:type III secretory pathway component EscV
METVAADTPSIKLFVSVSSTLDLSLLNEGFALGQEIFFDAMGVLCPKVQIEKSEALPANSFQLRINNLPGEPMSGLDPEEFLINCKVSQLGELGLTGRPIIDPQTGNEFAIARGGEEAKKKATEHGFTMMNDLGYLLYMVTVVLRQNMGIFLTDELVQHYLSTLRQIYPALVDATLEQHDVASLTEILRERLNTPASIKDLPSILENLLAASAAG